MLFLVYITLLSVCLLLRRCCRPSLKNLAALKQFGAYDNKHFELQVSSGRVGCSFSDTIISANSEYRRSGSLVFWLFWYLLFFWQNIQISSSTLEVLGASLDDLFASWSAGSTDAAFLVIESRSFFMVKMLRHFRWYWTGGISPSPRPSSRSKIGACCRICAATILDSGVTLGWSHHWNPHWSNRWCTSSVPAL